ncbi:MerR family DNA-binding transcriptional regulator, partial [Sphaerisporangium aureirubrum]
MLGAQLPGTDSGDGRDGAAGRRWRASELARAAGISVQQVRNYVDQGVLPPVRRTPSGYRIFTEEHARALTVARRMADGHGWGRTRVIMRAVHEGDLDTALAELDRGHAELDHERAEIAQVLGAFETLVTHPTIATTSRRRGQPRAREPWNQEPQGRRETEARETRGQKAQEREGSGREAQGHEARGREAGGLAGSGGEARGRDAQGHEARQWEGSGREAQGHEARGREAREWESRGRE